MDNQPNQAIDFSSVLASAVHDMKNSLCMLIQSIDTLSVNQQDPEQAKELASIHYEASRLNTNLLQMLSLYRVEKDQLPLFVEEHHIYDLVEELVEKNRFYAQSKAIDIDVCVDEDLEWFVDANLVGNLLNDVFVNALRYTKDKIRFDAKIIDERLHISISDNGNGYPQHMLNSNELPMQELDLGNNRTGLGLFFARIIASAHTNKSRSGEIKLANNGQLGGSVFTLILP